MTLSYKPCSPEREMLSQRSRCGAMKCQEDLEKTCISKWQQVAFAFHAHLKREDRRHEHILPATAMMGNQAGGENRASHNDVSSQTI